MKTIDEIRIGDLTPGPWTLDQTWMMIKGPNAEEVCAIHGGEAETVRKNRNVAHSNAEAIAALPEVLHTLRDVEIWLTAEAKGYMAKEHREQSRDMHLEAIRKALGKAGL